MKKPPNLTNSKEFREYTEEMKRIKEDECYFILEYLFLFHPKSVEDILSRLRDIKHEWEWIEKVKKGEEIFSKKEMSRAYQKLVSYDSSPLTLDLED